MRKSFQLLGLFALILSLSLTSCGPSKKLVLSQARVNELQKDNAQKQNQIDNKENQLIDCNMQVRNLKQETSSLQDENASVLNDLKILSKESKMTIAEQAKRLKDLQNMIQSQRNVMDNLKNSIADALMKYKSDELSVYTRDGNVYVSLAEKLLFKSGSDVVDPKGKEALATLARVLSNTKDITVQIEGHTDNVPIKTNKFNDNWALSTSRAISIVRILTKDSGFDPNRITASGRGQFFPVQTNETAEGRASNRRTEVILSPDMKELYHLLYN